MVKLRPKTLGSIPKDAKSKLKTTAYGHVRNIPQEKESAVIDQAKKSTQMKVSENSTKVKPPTRPSELFNNKTPLQFQQPSESLKVDKPIEVDKSVAIDTPAETEKPAAIAKPAVIDKPVNIESSTILTEESVKNSIEDEKPSPTIDIKQAEHAKKTLIELKLKKADLYKMTLDFDMKELTGEISAEELEEKKKKIREYEEKIEKQIQELRQLLGE
jgi:hypothetical protein